MDKDRFEKWLQTKRNELLKYKPKDEANKAYMLGATTAFNEILLLVMEGKFDKDNA